ncbi:MAG: aspartyl-phosphate phosphatase Spo0E family protein [Kyrpidia tusciae]|nr:aspartyl-phosphate phosphatase Spo0E family protein [Kyrpidia tusciae]MBE3552753.1 aspartyl-phosphate phosphatase Spo0E family protein [Kyrpidia tusciae]
MLVVADQISRLRAELVQLFEQCNGRLSDPQMVRKSQQLDHLVVFVQRMRLEEHNQQCIAT